jgi:hypothetical protein
VQRGGGFAVAQSPARRDRAERGGGGARVAVAAAGWRGETQGGVGVRLKEVAEDLGVPCPGVIPARLAGAVGRGHVGEGGTDRWGRGVSERAGERASALRAGKVRLMRGPVLSVSQGGRAKTG